MHLYTRYPPFHALVYCPPSPSAHSLPVYNSPLLTTSFKPRTMLNRSLPYLLEDRTGVFTTSDFDDIYDRLFLRVSPPPPSSPSPTPSPFSLMIYNTGRRSTSALKHDFAHHYHHAHRATGMHELPALVLEFGPRGALGNIVFSSKKESMPMGHWLKKTSLFGGCVTWLVRSLRTLTAPSNPVDRSHANSGRQMVKSTDGCIRAQKGTSGQ